MNFVVAQVSPVLCLNSKDFIQAIDGKIKEIINEYPGTDLILFPEALGLWMCMMQPTNWLSKIFSVFLHSHQHNAVRFLNVSNDINMDEFMANLQFAKPEKPFIKKAETGLLDAFPSYAIQSKNSIANKLSNFANWVFSKVKLRFLAQWLRSKEMSKIYNTAFSLAAQKYNVYIQAGSIFERVPNGTKNVAYTFAPDGSEICRQEKWRPIPFEGMLGVIDGTGYQIFEVEGVKCGIAICSDLNHSHSLVEVLAQNGCELIAGPSGGIVPSHLWNFDYQRDIANAHLARANESNVMIGRAYNAGDLLGGILKFQGRSSIVEPNKLLKIVPKDKMLSSYNLDNEMKKP